MNLEKMLNEQVANLIVFYVKLHNYHWFVNGTEFFRLHELFEALYDETTEHYDEVAERMLMLEMTPVATLKGSLELATIKEATNKETTDEMIQSVLNDFIHLNERFGKVMEAAEEAEDDVTADVLTTIRSGFQKHIWMLKEMLK